MPVTRLPLGFHLSLHLEDSRVIARSIAERRRVARIVLRQGEPFNLVAFRLADTHLHLEVCCGRQPAGELCRRVEIALALALRPGIGFAPPFIEPIRNQGHLYNAFNYVMEQEPNHGIDLDPCFEASNLPDLLRMRLLGRYTRVALAALLPRVREQQLIGYLGLAAMGEAAGGSLEHVVDAALAATGLPGFTGHSLEENRARGLVLALAPTAASGGQLAAALSVSSRTIRRLRGQAVDPELVTAARRQLFVRRALAERRAPPAPVPAQAAAGT